MYQYTFDEETTKKIKDSTTKSGDVFEKFDDIDKKYNNIANTKTELDLTEMPYVNYTEAEIEQKAGNNLIEYKNSNIDSINNNYDDKIKSIGENVEKVKNNALETEEKLQNSYEIVKENAKNDAIKRGLARSSIIVNQLASLDQNMLNTLEKQRTETIAKIENLDAQKTLLEQQKQNALDAFDISYAVKLQNEIESINKEIFNQNQTALKYNNQIAETIAKWEKDNEDDFYKKSKELVELSDKYGLNMFEIIKQNEKYQIAKDYFEGMSKQQALAELESNSAYKQNLGSKYNKLKEEISNR